jgi:sugar phosphate isomerase/epimerase
MVLSDLGIEVQTVLGMPPVEFVNLSADLGCTHVSISPESGGTSGRYEYPPYSLCDDPKLRSLLLSTLDNRGVSISLAESIVIRSGADVRDGAPRILDTLAGLGVKLVNAVTMDDDLQRSYDQYAYVTEIAGERGLATTIEFAKSLTISDLHSALAVIQHVGRPDFTLLIDTMHVVRSGNTPSDLAALDPAMIGCVQLSDHSLHQQGRVYRDDSSDRVVPGEGEMPLVDILAVLPPDVIIGVEAPMPSRVNSGTSVAECTRLAVMGARRVIDLVPLNTTGVSEGPPKVTGLAHPR